MPEGFRTRVGTEADVPEILAVLAASLGETSLLQRTPELFSWKHLDNPFGSSIILVAEADQRIIGLRAFMRWELTTAEGHEVRCVRAVDTATHPDFQGRGVFRELTMSAVEQAASEGVHLVFNTPNEKSAPGYLKMGWKEVGQVTPLVRARFGTAQMPDADGLVSLDRVLPEAEEFEPTPMERPPLGLRTPRTTEYQKWRFLSHPTARYGWMPDSDGRGAVVRASARGGRAELLVAELTAGPGLLRSLARSHRARYMAAAFTRGTPERGSAMRAGMFRPPGVRGLRLVANPLSDLDVDVFDLACWDLSLGDLELL